MNKILRFSDSEKVFQCPICKTDLKLKQKSLFCSNHHCFDISKTGYVNFAVGTKSSKHYSRETFQIRREVLEKGYYSHILNEVVQLIKSFSSIDTILDIGCGEGYYSKQIKEVSGDKEIIAFDISKDAVQLAAKSDFSNSIKWFVGNLEEMPIKDKRIDCILDIFTPANYSEFNRVLKEGGYVIKVIPGNAHLKELRETAKEQLKSNQYSNAAVVDYFQKKYSVVYHKKVSATYTMTSEEIKTFADMTPLLFCVNKDGIDFIKTNSDGHISLDDLKTKLDSNVILVVATALDSELGTLQDYNEIALEVKKYPHAHYLCDVTQAIAKYDINLANLDLVSFTPHKFGGLTGTGVLLKRKNTILIPLINGGSSLTVYRSGSIPVGLIASTIKACEIMTSNRNDNILKLLHLKDIFLSLVALNKNIQINSFENLFIFIIVIKNLKASEIVELLSNHKIYVSQKSACSIKNTPSKIVMSVYHDKKRALESFRVSISENTTEMEIEKLFKVLEDI